MISDIQRELKDLGFKVEKSFWWNEMDIMLQEARNKALAKGKKEFYDKKITDNLYSKMIRTGGFMEDTLNELKAINDEMTNSKKILENLFNEIREIGSIVNETFLAQLKELRSNRMTIVLELKTCLSTLQDIRKFFLESDYKIEMERLKEFTELCGRIKLLKDDGTLDAICDAAIKMAIKEGGKK